MSGTDSDLDFESADEDAEFISSAKSKKVFNVSVTDEIIGVQNLKKQLDSHAQNFGSAPKCSIEPNKAPDKLENTQTEIIDDIPISEVTKIVDNHLIKESQIETTEIDDTPVTDNKTDPSSESTSVIKESLSTGNKNDTELRESTSDDSCTVTEDKSAESNSKQEKRRVVLRLEKKIHEKNQIPIESCSEREKPSDLVNILTDQESKKQISWGFSSWGSSLLSSAASSVSTFSSQVSQGIGTVLETVENTLGAPPPEDLATALNEKKQQEDEASSETADGQTDSKASLLPDVSSWTRVLESTGSKVLMGGLDTLELIGKKTMDILTEGDPGLRKKRAAFNDGEYLSQILREAKERADMEDHKVGFEDGEYIHYSQIFDEKQGLVHLEALEILFNQCQAKYHRLQMRYSKNMEIKKRLEEIKSICENISFSDDPSDCEHFEDFETVFKKHTLELSLPLNAENIIKTQRQINDIISKYEKVSSDSKNSTKEIYQSAICSLATFTAKCIETFHKVAELILVQPSLDLELEQCATNLTGLTTVMCIEINYLSLRYHKCLEATSELSNAKETTDKVDVTTLATNLYVEASNSNKYIQDAYQMLVPVLQICLLQALE